MLRKLFQTDKDVAGFIVRLTLGVVFLPHGLQKLLGLFGGAGFSETLHHFVQLGMPAVLAFLVIVGESFGAFGLLIGFLTRFCGFGIGLIMLGAIFLVHAQNGFFMNWLGTRQGEGFEYHLLVLGLCVLAIIKGGGKWSLDGLLIKT
ncbi:MAG: DoxX family protein [Candidatus Binatia bacterium]